MTVQPDPPSADLPGVVLPIDADRIMQMLPHRFVIAHLSQKLEKYHQAAKRCDRPYGLA